VWRPTTIHIRRKQRDATSAFDAIIPDLYDTLHRPETWPAVLTRVQDAAGLKVAYVAFKDATTGKPFFEAHSEGVSAESARLYSEGYYKVNPFLAVELTALPGSLESAYRRFSRDFIRNHPFFNEWLAPSAGIGDVATAKLLSGNGRLGVAVFGKNVRSDPFGKRELGTVRPLLPHLRRAMQVKYHLASVDMGVASLAAALDRLKAGVMVLDGDGAVRHCNEAAEALLWAGDGLCLQERRLRARDAKTSSRLEQLIAEATQCASGDEPHRGGGELAIPRRAKKRPLLVLVAPLPEFSAHRFGRSQPAVAIFITDPDERQVPESRLAELFGLTPAEARLASRLAAGDTLTEAADAFCLSKETLRVQLRALMDKTGTNRQSELVRLLALVDAVRPHES
jgi:DNA-binding CsgD family transcriptional regulator/PAS domain-containing protein